MNDKTSSRTRIVDTAAQLFYSHGFESVGLKKICQQAEVSKSSFYHFFGSKDDVAVAVLQAHWQQGKLQIESLLSSDITAVKKIYVIFDWMFGMADATCSSQGEVYGCPFGNLASELSNSNSAVREQMQSIFSYMTNNFIGLIEQAKAAGELDSDLDSQDTANSLVVIMQGMAVVGKVYNDPDRMRQNGVATLRLILRDTVPEEA